MSVPEKSAVLSEQVSAEIDRWLKKYPPEHKRSAVMPALMAAQDANGGFLTTELMDAIADYLGMEKISVYEVATFYSMYEQKPVGRYNILVCTNVSCLLCGSDDVVAHLKEKLGISFGETTPDGKFSVKEVECLAACDGAPMFQIGSKVYGNLTAQKIDSILDGLK